MAEITRRRTGELLRRLFSILLERPDGMRAKDALAALERQVELTEYERGTFGNGDRRFEKIVRFATVDCVKAGWMVKARGFWTITPEGQSALQGFEEPDEFYREAVRLYHHWKDSQPPSDEAEAELPLALEGSVEREVEQTFEMAEERARAEIDAFLAKMPPYEFQELVGALLEAMDYHVAWIAPPGKDGGIDVVAFTDVLGTRAPRIKVQVKRQQARVTVDGLRAFLAVLGDDDVGIFVNTGGFTRDADDEARTQARRRLTLIDGERFVELWVEHYQSLDDAARRRLPLRPIWYLAPND